MYKSGSSTRCAVDERGYEMDTGHRFPHVDPNDFVPQ